MAMTKAERARMAELEKAVKLARALRWPDYAEPSPMTEAEIKAGLQDGEIRWGLPQRVTPGWFVNTYERGKVSHGCSNGINHDRWNTNRTSTQGMGTMYRSELEALLVLRIAKTIEFASILADIDARIEQHR